MQRPCDFCGKPYEAKLSTSKYCSSAHRVAASKQRRAAGVQPVSAVAQLNTVDGALTLATQTKLELAERLGSPLGQASLALARRIDAGTEHGSAMAALVRELRATLEAALKGAARAPDVLDELEAKRLERARRAGVG